MRNLSIIAAIDRNNAIGRNGQLLCHLPADLKHFKELTSGHTIIMGRVTFDSLPKGALPNRRNIVVTRNPNFKAEGVETALSVEDALWMSRDDSEVFVIGGGQIYRETLPLSTHLYLTRIDASFSDADTFFPEINLNVWTETSCKHFSADEKHAYAFSFVNYRR